MPRLPSDSRVPRPVILGAAVCAAVVIASQLSGKTARDAIFLEHFAVSRLPILLAVSSALAIVTTFWFARRLARGAPTRVVQATNIISAGMLVAEWVLVDQFPQPISVIIYIHQTLLGPILVSGFWSIVSERFDPRSARRALGTIGFGATLGGLAGAILAERVAVMIGTAAILPTVATLQVIAATQLSMIGGKRAEAAADDTPDEPLTSAAGHIARVSLLRRLAAITVTVTVAAALLDYVFKAVAASEVTHSADLARLFAFFHGVVGVSTALVQWLFGRWALQSWGLARTLATLPASVIVFGAVALVMPGVATFVLLRGAENVLRNSLYREAYEVFFTPLLAHERRATKTVIDVGVERFGDVIGGLLVVLLIGVLASPTVPLVAGAIGLSVIGVMIALKAQASYVEALERSLVVNAIELEKDGPHDRTTRATMEMIAQRGLALPHPSPQVSKSSWFRRARARRDASAAEKSSSQLEPDLVRLGDLASRDPARIRRALEAELPPAGVRYVLPLLVHPELKALAKAAVERVAHKNVGQLVDALLDAELPAPVRCRIPILIANRALVPVTESSPARDVRTSEVARTGLLAGMIDPERDIRYASAEALLVLREREPDLVFDDAVVFEGVRRELALDPAVWKAIDVASSEAMLAARSETHPELSRAVDHLATLLALALPAEPIRAAFQGLWSEDPAIRGVALEYLENVLPEDIRDHLWLVFAVDGKASDRPRRSVDEVLGDLVRPRQPAPTVP